MVSALKLPVLKTGEYDLWSMRMEQYLTFTDYALWQVIVNGDLVIPIASASAGAESPIPPKNAEQKLARKNELKAKSTLMLAIPDEHLLKFYACKDEKSQWEAIKNRFGGNKESKKMQKTILKHNYKNFAASSQEGLDKTYDRFQKLISQLEIHVNTAYSVSAASSKDQASTASYADDVMFSFFANQSNAPQLDNKDLEQIDADDLEEMDLKWQVAMLTMRVKRFIKKIEWKLDLNGKETVGFDRTKFECYNFHRRGYFAREYRAPRNKGNRNRDDPIRNAPVDTSTTNALVVQDGIGGYDWSFQAEEGIINFALMAYTSQGSSSSSSLNSELEEDLKEKDDLKLKLEKFEESSKNLTKLINSQISTKDKTGLGYDSQMNESELNNIHMNKSVFNSRESDVDDSPVNDRFKTSEGFHAVPPPYTGNYMPPRPDLSFAGLDESVFQSAIKKTTTSDTDSDNNSVFRPKSDQTKPKFTKINFVKSGENVKSVNKENTHRQVEYPRKSQSPRDNRRNWNGMMTQKLGNGFEFIKKACFVCGSFNHLIKDCDFHDNKMVEKPVLNNKGRVTGQREIRPVWNNAQRVNHQNKLTHPHPKRNFVPTAVATKSGQVPVNAAKQSSPRAATSISTARPVNTAAPKSKVNDALPITYSYFKAHSPLVLLREMGKMLLSPQHAGFGDQQEMLLTIPPKTVDHTCLKDLTMLIYKADSSQ
ncbi:hypothetical protein Tco_0448097 [Tanacetum coccineum]